MKINKIKKNLLDLTYQRHLQKTHTWYHTGIGLSIGGVGVVIGMRETGLLFLSPIPTFYLMIITAFIPWIFVIPLIRLERGLRASTFRQLRDLEKKEESV